MAVYLKSPAELKLMREAGRITALALGEIRAAIRPGISTWELDQIAVRIFEQHKVRPAFLGYPPNSRHPFPATIIACLNDELVHGIPSKKRLLQEGDIVTIDTACHYQGYVGDAAFTVGVGPIPAETQRLLDVTEQALYVGIQASHVGSDTKRVGQAIQQYVESQGYNVIRGYTGHGVGRRMHEDPDMPNWWPNDRELRRSPQKWRNLPLKKGMTYALEPMVTLGSPDTKELGDHWTVVTKDGALCAHFEHTIAVTEGEALILTLP